MTLIDAVRFLVDCLMLNVCLEMLVNGICSGCGGIRNFTHVFIVTN